MIIIIYNLSLQLLNYQHFLQNIRFSLERNGDGVFGISSSGQIILEFELDYELQQEYNLHIYVSDGEFVSTICKVFA